MPTPIQPITSAALPASLALPQASAGEPSAVSFARLMAEMENPVTAAQTAPELMPGASAQLSDAGWGDAFGSVQESLMVTLIKLIERLESDEEAGEAALPEGYPVLGRVSHGYHAGHHGIDIAVPVGTPIKATMGGEVVFAGWNNQGYGNLVILEQGKQRTYYAHLDRIPMEVGEHVERGQLVGYSGNTGNSTGPPALRSAPRRHAHTTRVGRTHS
jgi:murein DD-endopeptidase MepM/ murein hydrolase activator NlpD